METLQKRLDALEQQTEQLKRHLRRWRRLAYALGALGFPALPLASVKAQVAQSLEQRVEQLEYKLAHVTSGPDDITISGANLHIVNGLGATDTTNGLGNLIVGYNEHRPPTALPPTTDIRTGSHNVVVGREHNFSRFGGLVVGDSMRSVDPGLQSAVVNLALPAASLPPSAGVRTELLHWTTTGLLEPCSNPTSQLAGSEAGGSMRL